MRPMLPFGFLAATSSLFQGAMAQEDAGGFVPQARERPPWETVEITTHHVAGNIYYLEGEGGNIGLSVGEDGIIIIDDQFAPLTEKILAAIRTISSAEIRFLINTHVHDDHVGGNENFARLGARIIAHENVRVRMTEGIRGNPPSQKGALPILTFTESVKLHLNGEEVHVFRVPPAHTDGDAYVYFTESDVLHAGDVFRTNGYPNIDVGNGGTLQGTLDALQLTIDMLGPDTKIIPGHGVVSTREAVVELRNVALEVLERVSRLVEAGMTLQEVIEARPTADLDARWGERWDRLLPGVYYAVTGEAPD